MKIFVVLPAYNEEKQIGNVIRSLKKNSYKNIVVVDDGSSDKTSSISRKEGAVVVRNIMNMGVGGASVAGIEYAFRIGADIVVTLDSDGQHDVKDIKKVIMPLLNNSADVVSGSRMFNPKGMPLIRKVGNFGLSFITFILFGIWSTDSQSGF